MIVALPGLFSYLFFTKFLERKVFLLFAQYEPSRIAAKSFSVKFSVRGGVVM